ncbi:MAG: lytic transglycosylase domain-containing protein, partial [Erythrobacter sp.]
MKKCSRTALVAIGLFSFSSIPTIATAQVSGSLAANYDSQEQSSEAIEPVLNANEQRLYTAVFDAIERQQWQQVEQLLAQNPDGVLHQVALAEYYTHAKSPKVSPGQIHEWFAMGVHLPQTEQLARMGKKRGVENLPDAPKAQSFQRQPYASKRIRPRTVNDGTMPSSAKSKILSAIKDDNPQGAYETLAQVDSGLSSEARAEWRQKVAWSFYIENDDANALALAEQVSEGSGPWVAEGEWVAGLAAWRLGYCALSGEAFARSAQGASNVELRTAAHYWANRALVRCREPGRAQEHLRAAARDHETLYGMLAADQLGMDLPLGAMAQPLTKSDWRQLE